MEEPKWLAHSARVEQGIPSQGYGEHVQAVALNARNAIRQANAFRPSGAYPKLEQVIAWAATFHDLGKLEDLNQAVLRSTGERKPLPVPHEDAGAAWCLRHGQMLAAWLICSHHQGLTSYIEESRKDDLSKQNDQLAAFRDARIRQQTDQRLDSLFARHQQAVQGALLPPEPTNELPRLTMRLLLSALVDGDHGDTARHYGQEPDIVPPAPRWSERLARLEQYVRNLGNKHDARNSLRRDVYEACRNSPTDVPVWACDAPVGSGKTTAVMAYLLRAAIERKLRRIFVVLPFTNIINQSVAVYRKSLVLEGEDPESIVAAHHHATEFSTPELRALTTTWNSPVIVTTAVQFFETLAACATPRLRKLHGLPGSAVFVDEAHAAMPIHLWPYMWRHIEKLCKDWSCRFVLGSGSLPRLWENSRLFATAATTVPSMIPPELAQTGTRGEQERVEIRSYTQPHSLNSLCDWISSFPGARLVVMNTVQSAAVLARELRSRNIDTLHLSTALTPDDREQVLQKVKHLLSPYRPASGWILVATSCIEAGVDVSFDVAFRERSSVSSLIQISGRVNRHGNAARAEVWDFVASDLLFRQNPALIGSIAVVADVFQQHRWSANLTDLMTWATEQEWKRSPHDDKVEHLRSLEEQADFPAVAGLAQLINEETMMAVVDQTILEKLRSRSRVSRIELTRGSVAIRGSMLRRLALNALPGTEEVYEWPEGTYDLGFLGIMKYVLNLTAINKDGLAIV